MSVSFECIKNIKADGTDWAEVWDLKIRKNYFIFILYTLLTRIKIPKVRYKTFNIRQTRGRHSIRLKLSYSGYFSTWNAHTINTQY